MPVVCPSPKPQANHISPLSLLLLLRPFTLHTAKIHRRGKPIATVIAGSAKLRTWKEEEEEDLDRGVFSSPLLLPASYTVECGAVCGGRYNPEQRSLEAGNERAETSFAITFETGPNASLRPNNSTSAARISRRSFPPQKGERRRRRRRTKKTHTSRQCFHKTDHR